MDPDSSLRIVVTDGRGRRVRDGGLARWLTKVAPRSARGELSVALVTDARMRTLNRSYRARDYATDVLSFSAENGAPRTARRARLRQGYGEVSPERFARRRTPRHLGDIVIATGVARRQARDAGHSYQTELRVLALHGLLHLLGYDHEHRADRGRMARREASLRRKGGLKAGLIARAAATGA